MGKIPKPQVREMKRGFYHGRNEITDREDIKLAEVGLYTYLLRYSNGTNMVTQIGDKSASIRRLADVAGINPNTCSKHIRGLQEKGIIKVHKTKIDNLKEPCSFELLDQSSVPKNNTEEHQNGETPVLKNNTEPVLKNNTENEQPVPKINTDPVPKIKPYYKEKENKKDISKRESKRKTENHPTTTSHNQPNGLTPKPISQERLNSLIDQTTNEPLTDEEFLWYYQREHEKVFGKEVKRFNKEQVEHAYDLIFGYADYKIHLAHVEMGKRLLVLPEFLKAFKNGDGHHTFSFGMFETQQENLVRYMDIALENMNLAPKERKPYNWTGSKKEPEQQQGDVIPEWFKERKKKQREEREQEHERVNEVF